MKKFVALAALLAMVVLVVGAPALAQDPHLETTVPVEEGSETAMPTGELLSEGSLDPHLETTVPAEEGSETATPTGGELLDEGSLDPPTEAPPTQASPEEELSEAPSEVKKPDGGVAIDAETDPEADSGEADDNSEAAQSEAAQRAGEKREADDSEIEQVLRDEDEEDEEDEDEDDPEQGEIEQEAETGDIEQEAQVINTGDNVNQCVGILQAANTGSNQNAQGVEQSDTEDGEVEIEGAGNLTITPELVVDCRQTILQLVMAERKTELLKGAKGKALRTALNASVARGGGSVPKTLRASAVGQPRGGGAAARGGRLPRTGGFSVSDVAPLLGLGTGVLLIGGGVLVRKVFQ